MTVFALKLLAMVSMVCDHLGYFLYMKLLIDYDIYILMRSFGRLAFPIFAFLIANGYSHSHDRVKYLSRLTGFALISQLPFTLVFTVENYLGLRGAWHFEFMHPAFLLLALMVGVLWLRYVRAGVSAALPVLALALGLSTLRCGNIYLLRPDMNVFYTLAMGLALIWLADSLMNKKERGKEFLPRAAALLLAFILIWDRADYGLNGMLLILIFWLFRERSWQQLIMLVLWAFLQTPPFGGNVPSFFICTAAAALPLALYNGRPGRAMKNAFYLIYPLHLLLIGIFVII